MKMQFDSAGELRRRTSDAGPSVAGTVAGVLTYTLDDAVGQARLQAKVRNLKGQDDLEKNSDVIESWEANVGVEAIRSVQAALPNLDLSGLARLTPVPSMRGTFVRVHPEYIPKSAARVISLAYAHSQRNSLGPAVDVAWEAANARVMHSESGPPAATAEPSRCLKFGVCVCKRGNPKLWNFKNDVFKATKAALPWSSDPVAHKLCGDGFLVFEFEPWVSFAAGGEPEGFVRPSIYMHVGMFYFSPYRPTFHLLTRAAAPAGEPAEDETRRFVKAFSHNKEV